ncbi:hypothetical protein [Streptomyces sp. NPDC088358]|uniref:hypothetical protein n=1 Tax=Streptomyces sp. NPDC088358 TaxID=3365857 RepID=UPI003827FE7A
MTPSPDIELRLIVKRNGPPPGFSLSVDLIPRSPLEDDSVFRCEAQAREVARRLGLVGRVLYEFALEVALDGKDLPYNRVKAPGLLPVFDDQPGLDVDGPESFVRVFTAKVPSNAAVAYMVRRVD